MVLFFVIVILLISASIEAWKRYSWKQDQINKHPDSDEYWDYNGVTRDRKTDDIRFHNWNSDGDYVVYDSKMREVRNITQDNADWEIQKAIAKLGFEGKKKFSVVYIPRHRAEKFNDKEWKRYHPDYMAIDLFTKSRYLVLRGCKERKMANSYFYYDYREKEVVRPTDRQLERLKISQEELEELRRHALWSELKDNSYNKEKVYKEMKLLQKELQLGWEPDWADFMENDQEEYEQSQFTKFKRLKGE